MARFNRLKSLHQQGAISQEQLEQAEAELEIAKVDYDIAIAAAGTKLEQSQTELSQLQEKLAIQEQQDAISQLEKQKQTAQLEFQQATEKLDRWRVEDYHQILKSGCQSEHRLAAVGMKTLLGFLSVIAVELLQVTYLHRTQPDAPAIAGAVRGAQSLSSIQFSLKS